ncbi:MAG TPA: hypothetical protein VM784_07500 [Actinomycetota bacterium]|jgi:hypothetical protein|nr:hypothetical protein [Actinomycetota bacterium]
MTKHDVLEAIGKMIFPAGIEDAVYTLGDAVPDMAIQAFYPSFRWIDRDARIREDVIVLLTDRSLVRCRVKTNGFETVDYLGRLDVRQESRSVEVEGISLDSIAKWIVTRLEGPRSRGGDAVFERSLRISFVDDGFGGELVLPFWHDLDEADLDDKDDVASRVERFTTALVESLTQSGVARETPS